jgi:type VI secretion system secreted protein VgrG
MNQSTLLADAIDFRFDCPDLPDVFFVQRFEATEALNEPYALTIDLQAEDGATDCYRLLGRDVVLTLELRELERSFRGIVDRIAVGATSLGKPMCSVTVVPALFALGRNLTTRIFQDMTALAIVEQVLREGLTPYHRSFRSRVDASRLAVRDYCVQYRESNLAFVHRLLEEEGIGYFFDHDGAREELILADDHAALLRAAASAVQYDHDAEQATRGRMIAFAGTARRGATHLTTRDYDWRIGERGALEDAGAFSDASPPHEIYEHSEHVIREDTALLLEMVNALTTSLLGVDLPPAIADRVMDLRGPVLDRFSSSNTADRGRVRRELHARDLHTFEGTSLVPWLSPGTRFDLVGHPIHDAEYYVTRVVHSSSAPLGYSAQGSLRYHNRVHCLPSVRRWRPSAITRKPRIEGVQTATVTGPPGLDVYTDPTGRIRVRFHWDRAQDDLTGHFTCWLRVSQAWAGPTAPAFLFIPRVGMEVVVSFVDGDPDRPIVTGCVYNGDHPTPALLPAQATKSVIRTRSIPMGTGYNELSFDDALGMERVHLRAERDLSQLVQNDLDVRVHRNEHRSVGGGRVDEVGVDHALAIGRHYERTVGGHSTESTDGDATRRVRGALQESVGRGYELDVHGALNTQASGEWSAYATGITVGAGASMLRLTDEETQRGHDNEKGMTLTSFGSMAHLTENKIQLKVGESVLEIANDKIELTLGGSKLVVTKEAIVVNGKTLPAGG